MQTQQDIIAQQPAQVIAGMDQLSRELYLKQLCSTVGFPWEKLPVTRFAEMHDHAAINQLFFSLEVPRPEIRLNPNQVHSLKQMEFRRNDIAEVRNSLKAAREDWEEKVRRSNEAMQLLMDTQRELDEAESIKVKPMLESVEAVHRDGRWKCVKVSKVDQIVEFIQMTDTILTWKDEKKAVNQQVNLGRFRVRIRLNGEVKIYPFYDNVECDRYYHPHVKNDGWVCWGNAANEVQRAFRANDFGRILGILQVFLQEYNPASPYKEIMRFIVERGKKVTPVPVIMGSFWFTRSTTDKIPFPFVAEDSSFRRVNPEFAAEAYLVMCYATPEGEPMIREEVTFGGTPKYNALPQGITWFDNVQDALDEEVRQHAQQATPQGPVTEMTF